MRFFNPHELMKQTPLAPDYAEIIMPFHGGNEKVEGAVAAGVHEILVLAFACVEAWLKPLFSQAERQNLRPIQEYDPYLVDLM